jgi:tetratricopeptide (TPR) repeat protein
LEQNIPEAAIADATLRLVRDAFDLLKALGRGLDGMASRLLLTCRYKCELPSELRLHGEQLDQMGRGDVRKQCQRLSLPPDNKLTRQLVTIADGNPRLLVWLGKVVTAEDWAEADISALLVKLEGVETRFRENLLLEMLLGALGEPERKDLARLSVVQLPIEEGLVTELASAVDLEKLTGLTLVEPSLRDGVPEYRVPSVVGKVLVGELADCQAEQKRATEILHRVWWEDGDGCETDRAMEILRLGLMAQSWEIAVTVGDSMATSRVNDSRFVEAQLLCDMILAVHGDYRIWHCLARAQAVLGETGPAIEHYEKARLACPEDNPKQQAAILGNLSSLVVQQGDIDRALELWNESLEIKERIGDVQGKAATLSNMAGVIAQQGDIDRALELWNESLEILERIGDVKGKAATLNNMAGVIAQQGDIDRALELWNESLEIKERIGDVQGKAATLANVGGVLAGQGDFATAIAYLEESIALLERIRDIRSHQVRQMLDQVRQMQAMKQNPELLEFIKQLAENPDLQAALEGDLTDDQMRELMESLLGDIDIEELLNRIEPDPD